MNKLNDDIERLFHEVLRARQCYEAWWVLKNRRYRSKYQGVFSTYSTYFCVAIHSHFVSTVLAIARLFDKDKRTLSLITIRSKLNSTGIFSKSLHDTYKQKLREFEPVTRKITLLRNKIFAHQDTDYDYEKAFREAAIRPTDLKKVTDGSLTLVNMLRNAHEMGTYSYNKDIAADLVQIIRVLHNDAI